MCLWFYRNFFTLEYSTFYTYVLFPVFVAVDNSDVTNKTVYWLMGSMEINRKQALKAWYVFKNSMKF